MFAECRCLLGAGRWVTIRPEPGLYDATALVLLGSGDGAFRPAGPYPTGTGPSAVAVADFTGDDIADAASANQYDGTVTVLLSDGADALRPSGPYLTGASPSAISTVTAQPISSSRTPATPPCRCC